MDLSIIIVSWNVREKLRENLRAIYNNVAAGFKPASTSSTSSMLGKAGLKPATTADEAGLKPSDEAGLKPASTVINFEVFVIDNNSADGTGEMVKTEFPQVKLIVNEKNLGFAKANNQAIKEAHSDFILLLNPDMRVFPDTLYNMLEWMKKNGQASVAGCKLINENGEIIKHVRRFPTVWDQTAIILKLPHLFPSILKNYIRHDFDYGTASPVDSIRGGFFLLRRKTIEKIGLLDERYFVWFEEVDYCRRVKLSGGAVWYTPQAQCIDFIGQSFKQIKRGEAQKYFCDSMLKYFKKWHPGWQYRLIKFSWSIGRIIVKAADLMKIKRQENT